ncbi:hypothetical protein [Comamonas sp.]|uniref:hypothetical protein n=1 Tax=Comamonas sp. TaxID=34028 RepID=UPI00258B35AF|nr:hypothetical protein [Comamonas sp.]
MNKELAIELLGGTPKKAAAAMGYRSIQAVYLWPAVLPQATADRVRGVLSRTAISPVGESAVNKEAAHG